MASFFYKLLDINIEISFVIVGVLIVRLLLKKSPKIYSYILWILVFARLLMPISIESSLSFMRVKDHALEDLSISKEYDRLQGLYDVNDYVDLAPVEEEGQSLSNNVRQLNIDYSSKKLMVEKTGIVFTYIWLAGVLILVTYSLISLYKLHIKIKRAVNLKENIYRSKNIHTAFVYGFFKPKIFIPYDLSDHDLTYVISHERVHIKRLDHIIKLIAYILTIINWFNPLIWLAYYLMEVDMELSCDERVLRELGPDVKKDYSLSLLSLSSGQNYGPGPLSFAGKNIKTRIKNILSYKKPRKIITLVSIGLVIMVVIGVLTDSPQTQGGSQDIFKNYVKDIVEDYEDSIFKVTDYRINSIDKVNTFSHITDNKLELWHIDYSLRFEDGDLYREKIGIGKDEGGGWFSQLEPGSYLLFEVDGPNKNYLGPINSHLSDKKPDQEGEIRAYLEREKIIEAETYPGDHIIISFKDSFQTTIKVLLSQPIRQGKGGIWIVERFIDSSGNIYYWPYNYDENIESHNYYERLQRSVDQGQDLWRLNPKDVGLEYIHNVIGQDQVSKNQLDLETYGDLDSFYQIPINIQTGFLMEIVTYDFAKEKVDTLHIDQVEIVDISQTDRIAELGLSDQDLEGGFALYNPTSYPYSIFLTENTVYKIARDEDIAGPRVQVSKEDFIERTESLSYDIFLEVHEIDGKAIEVVEGYLP